MTDAPALLVLDAFNVRRRAGEGGRRGTDFELASDIDYVQGPALGAGRLPARRRLAIAAMTRATTGGTFTFASLDAYRSRTADDVTRSAAATRWSSTRTRSSALYVQDDFRVARSLSLSFGLRQELQTHADDYLNLAPRLARRGRRSRAGRRRFRGGAGIFYDWYDAQTYEQTLRVDGVRQTDLVIQNPGLSRPIRRRQRHRAAVEPVSASRRPCSADDRSAPTSAVERVLGMYGRVNVALQLHARIRPVPRPQHQRAARRWRAARSELAATSPRSSPPAARRRTSSTPGST